MILNDDGFEGTRSKWFEFRLEKDGGGVGVVTPCLNIGTQFGILTPPSLTIILTSPPCLNIGPTPSTCFILSDPESTGASFEAVTGLDCCGWGFVWDEGMRGL